jgi:hypothetical protein
MSLKSWIHERRERRRRKRATRLGEADPEELQRLRELTSPVKAKWGYFPKL